MAGQSEQKNNNYYMNTKSNELNEQAASTLAICSKTVLTFKEAAMYLGVSSDTLYKWTMKRKIPFYKPNGKLIYFNRAEIESWLQSNRISTEAELESRAMAIEKKGGSL